MSVIEKLVQLLVESATHLGMGEHSYIVGGAPRDYTLGHEVKDVDVVVETRDNKNALTLGSEVARHLGLRGAHEDGLGVVHLGPFHEGTLYDGVGLTGQKIEIVTARKEKYDRTRGRESHKPVSVAPGNILDDLKRRDFTINTLLWRLSDLQNGFAQAPVVDMLGGLDDLKKGNLRTPLDPYETFDDDPSRMLRAIRFMAKYNFTIEERTYQAILDRSNELRRLAYSAIDPLFFDKILTLEWSRVEIALTTMSRVGLLKVVKEMIPASRQKRAILERFPKSFRKRLHLYWWGFTTDFRFVDAQGQRFRDADSYMSDEELNAYFAKFQNPIDTRRFIELTGAQGPAIGAAVEKARDLVLTGLSDERVMEELLLTHRKTTS